jgi:hypothetical protein
MTYEQDQIPVCVHCDNIDSLDRIKTCAKCSVQYCEHFSSEIDIRFCGNCMKDFKVTNSIEIRTTEQTNNAGEVIYKKRVQCKRLHLEGTDWLFTANKISTLSDDDLDCTIEYHRAIASLMLHEREERRIEKYQKLNKQVITLQRNSNVDNTGAVRGSLKTDAQKAEDAAYKQSKRTSTTKTKTPDAATLADAIALLIKSGISAEKIAELVGGKK